MHTHTAAAAAAVIRHHPPRQQRRRPRRAPAAAAATQQWSAQHTHSTHAPAAAQTAAQRMPPSSPPPLQQQRSSSSPGAADMDRNLLSSYRASSSWGDLDEARARPWRKVALAAFLFVAGAAMLTAGICTWYQAPGQGSAVALLVLGSICFLPGFYHTRIAFLAWRGVPGFSLDDIPDM